MTKLKSLSTILLFSALLILNLFLKSSQSMAWDGIDQEKNSTIEIPPGNLVREGLVIEFYDNEDLHMGRVASMIEFAGGTELVIEDFNEDKRERTLIMK